MPRLLARILSRLLSQQTLKRFARPPAEGEDESKCDHPPSRSAKRWAVAAAVSGVIAAELMLSLSADVLTLVNVFVENAGLVQTCPDPQEGP
jgi:hypothetical protein